MLHQVFLDVEAMSDTDREAPDTWTGGVPTWECPHIGTPSGTPWCMGINSTPMELIHHMQTGHRTPHVDLDPIPLDQIFGTRGDVDLDRGTSPDVDLDREPQWGFGEDWNF